MKSKQLIVVVLMAARLSFSPVDAYTRPKKANIDSNSQHPSMKRVGFKNPEDMRSLTNRGFNLDEYSTGCVVDEETGYYRGCGYTEQGITIWPTIAFNNEDGYQYYFEYGWTTCNEMIAQIKLDYFEAGLWETKKNYVDLANRSKWHYGELDRRGFTIKVCYDICQNTPGCGYFFFQTKNPGYDSDMHGVPLETSCELHKGCSEPRTTLYPGTTFEVLDVNLDCLDTCYGFSCEHYVKNGNYTCAELEDISFHCDCSGCDCVYDEGYVAPDKKTPASTTMAPPVESESNKTKMCYGFWSKPRNLDDPDCNTPPLSPWGGNLEHQICPGYVPGYLFQNHSCTGTTANCSSEVICDESAGYTGTVKVSCDVDGAKFNVSGCSRGDLVTENGKIFRYFTHLDCAQGNLHVVGLSTEGNPAGKTFGLLTPLECAEACNNWTALHPDNKCKAFSMGNGACKANDCERVTPDMCYNHCSNAGRCVLKNLTHCTNHLQRDLTYDLWWNIEDTSLKGYDQCSYRFAGNNNLGRKPDGGEDDKFDYERGTQDKVIFGSTKARPGKMDCVRDYGVDQNPESAALRHMNFGVWDRDGV